MTRLFERLVAWALRSAGTIMVFAGVSVLAAGVPLFGMLTGAAIARTMGVLLLQVSLVFIVAGAAAIYLSRRRQLLLPNEGEATSDKARPEVGSWLLLLPIVLVALPVGLVLRLRPFIAEWRRVLDFLRASDLWDGASASMSGIILVPLAGALTPPFFELTAMAGFIGASGVLLILFVLRSELFPRIYLGCIVLLSALVIASVRGTDAAQVAAQAVEQLIAGSSARPEEARQVRDVVTRYTEVVTTTAPDLVWTLFGYLVWLPAIFRSERVRTTFARAEVDRVSTRATAGDIEAITKPPHFLS